MPMTEEAKERNRALISVYCYGRPGTIKDPKAAGLLDLDEAVNKLLAQPELPQARSAMRIALTDLCRTVGNIKKSAVRNVELEAVVSKIVLLAEVLYTRGEPSTNDDLKRAFGAPLTYEKIPEGGDEAYSYALKYLIDHLPMLPGERPMAPRFIGYEEGFK